jgi:hypothetical protein
MVRYGKAISAELAAVSPTNATNLIVIFNMISSQPFASDSPTSVNSALL